MRSLLTIILILAFQLAMTQHPNAHAHNDYEQDKPLFTALEHGFTSIEIDAHLEHGQLWVAHDKPTSSSKLLETLYLKPIVSLINEQEGALYPEYSGDLFLMIDVKTEAEQTYAAIENLLQDYLHIIDTPLSMEDDDHPIRIFLSGNRPVRTIINSTNPTISLDGRPYDLNDSIAAALMPVVSSNFSKYSPFTIGGKISQQKEFLLKDYIQSVHNQGKKVRFWAHPDNEATWEYLLALGVDLINSDKLEELDAFLSKGGL